MLKTFMLPDPPKEKTAASICIKLNLDEEKAWSTCYRELRKSIKDDLYTNHMEVQLR